MKVDGLGGGMMRGSGRGLRFNLTFPSSSSPVSLSSSWMEEAELTQTYIFYNNHKQVSRLTDQIQGIKE